MEHLQHFGLSLDPFEIEPDLRFYYDSAVHNDALRRVERGLRQSKGLSILAGEGGTGKSLLARRLLGSLEEEIFEAALMVMLPGAADARSVVMRFGRHLEIEDLSDDPTKAMGQVYEQLAIVREDGRHSVLILDDAHLLGPDALAEVGALLNLEYEDRRLVSILLVGLPDLDVAIAGDRSLGQRVDIRVRLASLDQDATTAYLARRLEIAGGAEGIIPSEAVAALFKHSCGRPRLLNTLADNALFEAYLAGRQHLDACDIERAAADLGVLPGSPKGEAKSIAPASPASRPTAESSPPQSMESPELSASAAECDAEMDLGALLDSIGPVDDEASLVAEFPEVELDLDVEVAAEAEDVPSPAPGAAEETRLMLGDEISLGAGDEVGLMQSNDDGAIELGEPMALGDALEAQVNENALNRSADEEMPSFETPGAAEATRLMLPEEEQSLVLGEAPAAPEGDEIDALFDELLDD